MENWNALAIRCEKVTFLICIRLTARISSPCTISLSAQNMANGWCVATFWLLGPGFSAHTSYKHDEFKIPKKWSMMKPDSSVWDETDRQNSMMLLQKTIICFSLLYEYPNKICELSLLNEFKRRRRRYFPMKLHWFRHCQIHICFRFWANLPLEWKMRSEHFSAN